MSRPIPLVQGQETTTIHDTDMGQSIGYNYRPDPTRDAVFSTANDSLSKFFERPIVGATYTWTPLQGSPFTAILNPWTLFFSNPRVGNRINNYALMRANLHVRFLINGNGFYYGRLMADYAPLYTNDDCTSYATLVLDNAVSASQRMKLFIDPASCCSSELYLPFVYYKDAISPTSAEWANLGRVYIRELNGLKHANGSTQPLTITVMLWATEVETSIPTCVDTSGLVAQAGEDVPSADEYGVSPISAVASSGARVAAALTSLPVIGPYAKATSAALGGAAKVAAMFGLSRPTDLTPPVPMAPTYMSRLASANAPDMPQKLTMDVKQELTIDPNIIGIDLDDELSIAGIAARESYLTSFIWATTKVAGDLLWNTYVTPSVSRFTTPNYYPPACMFATVPFQYWRGKMRYRFQVVASGYHRGRLRIVWDPLYIASVESNVQLTTIVDISDSKDVTVEIDWGQPLHYLASGGLTNSNNRYTTTAIAVADGTKYNGVVGVYVLNDLATPNSTVNNDITVNVFVSMVDGQVAYPLNPPNTITNPYSWVQQAGEDAVSQDSTMAGCGPVVSDIQMGVDSSDNSEALVYFGERIVSFRELLKRYVNHSSFVIANNSATNHGLWTMVVPDFPVYYGYNTTSYHTTTTGAFKFNYVHQTWLGYLAPAFVASRGSLRTKYVVSSAAANDVIGLTLERGYSGITIPTAPTSLPVTSQSNYARATRASKLTGGLGAAYTPPSKQPVLEVELPYYKNVRFDEARIINIGNTSSTNPQSSSHALEVHLAPGTNTVAIDRFTSVGEDFSLFWFQGCPALSVLAAPA